MVAERSAGIYCKLFFGLFLNGGGTKIYFSVVLSFHYFFERCMAWHGIGSERNGLLGL